MSGKSFTGTSKVDTLNIAANNAAISGGGKVIFEGVNAGDKFNINSKTYTISGKTLK